MYYCEIGLDDGELVTTGIYGWVMVVTGVGATISLARANPLAERVLVPNLRYRQDVGERLISGD